MQKTIRIAAVCLPMMVYSHVAVAADIPNLFKNKTVEVYPKRGTPQDKAERQTEEALKALADLTFLSESDAHQYSRSLHTILGFYAYVDGGKIVLLGGTQQFKEKEIALKDVVIFRGAVKSGYSAGIGIPVLKIDLKSDEVAELTIQDVATIASRYSPDEIACNFPHSWRHLSKPTGPTQFYYIPAATVLSMNSRRFKGSDQGVSAVFSILNLGGKKYYSDETIGTKYLVSLSLSPVFPLSGEPCSKPKPVCPSADFQVDFTTESTVEPAADDPADPAHAAMMDVLSQQENDPDHRGAVYDVEVSRHMPPIPPQQ